MKTVPRLAGRPATQIERERFCFIVSTSISTSCVDRSAVVASPRLVCPSAHGSSSLPRDVSHLNRSASSQKLLIVFCCFLFTPPVSGVICFAPNQCVLSCTPFWPGSPVMYNCKENSTISPYLPFQAHGDERVLKKAIKF